MVRLAQWTIAMALFMVLTSRSSIADDQRTSLAAELGWVKFRVSAGKLQVVNTNFRENKEYETGNPLVGESEKFSLLVAVRETIVRYQRTTPSEQLTVEFLADGDVKIERRGDRSILPLTFTQRRNEPLHLVVGEGEQRQVFRGKTLWHLLLDGPTVAREQLVPILESLRPDWQLLKTADDLEVALVAVAASGRSPDRAAWGELVERLGSSRFGERRAAERQLREAGPAVVAYLQSLDTDALDAERRERIDRLLDSLSTTADDMPQRVAMWLVDDPAIWVSLLASDEVDHRRSAHQQLEKLLAMKVEFDADAESAVREKQSNALRRRVSP